MPVYDSEAMHRRRDIKTWFKAIYSGRADCLMIFMGLFMSLFLSLECCDSYALTMEISPSEIKPGDAFIIRITGISDASYTEFSGRTFDFDSCGKDCRIAICAADMDMQPGIHSVRVHAGDTFTEVAVDLKEAAFSTVELTLPESKVIPGPEDLKRIEREAALLRSIWQKRSPRMWDGLFITPLYNEYATPFGTKRIMNGTNTSIHRGVDIKGNEGDEVRAANNGCVVLSEELFFGGNTVVIDHGHGLYTIYMHLLGFAAGQGDCVAKGEVIGYVGSTGRSSGPHLHFGVHIGSMNVNPVSLIRLTL